MNLECKKHLPFPKAMCNMCMPSAAIINSQPYRHVDYAEFMGSKDISRFIDIWVSKSFSEQRFGWLYGYYAEDPNYKGGIRAIIETIYEPPQKGDIQGFELFEDPFDSKIDQLAEFLGLERIGWISTEINHDTFLDSKQIRRAAYYQELFKTTHQSGYPVSKFLTIIMRTKKNSTAEVLPEVYMVSDQAQAMERDNIFGPANKRRFMTMREPTDVNDILPTVVHQGKPVTEIDPEFFIVNVAFGQPKSNKYAIIKHHDFPIANREKEATLNDLRNYLTNFKHEKSYIKFADFNLLIFLAQLLDFDTAATIATCIANEEEISEGLELLIKNYVGL